MGNKFKLPKVASVYLDSLNTSSPLEIRENTKLNFYWLCAQLGIAYDERKNNEGNDLTDKFTTDLDDHSSMIKGLLLAAIWRYREVKKDDVQESFAKLLSADNNTKISSDGIDILDKFAAGGFNMIEEKIPSKNGWNYFMMKYHTIMQNAPPFEYKIIDDENKQ